MGIKVLLVVKEIEGAEPLGALYIAGCLQRAGHECKFVGTRGNRVEDEVRRFAPRVIATVESRGVHRPRSRRRHVHRLRQPREAATHPSAESDHAGDLEPTGIARCGLPRPMPQRMRRAMRRPRSCAAMPASMPRSIASSIARACRFRTTCSNSSQPDGCATHAPAPSATMPTRSQCTSTWRASEPEYTHSSLLRAALACAVIGA